MMHTDAGFPLTVGRGCTIGHRAILHGCTIGDNSLIGMGAIVLNGAKIGENSLVGAGALVTEGKEFPAGSLIVGAPAKVVRSLDGAAIAMLRRSAAHYVANAKRFAKGLESALTMKSWRRPGTDLRLNPIVGNREDWTGPRAASSLFQRTEPTATARPSLIDTQAPEFFSD